MLRPIRYGFSAWIFGGSRDPAQPEKDVVAWFAARPGEIAISTITLAELRAGIELKPQGKRRRELERDFQFIFEDYSGGILVFDEAAAFEWGRLMAEATSHPLAYDDSLIAAIARSVGLRVVTRNTIRLRSVKTA